MTYDQQRADLKLDAARLGAPYYPVADPDWVKKVVALAAKDIPKAKLYLGIPTYGREVALSVSPNKYGPYTQLHSVSNEVAEDTADKNHVTPIRNAAGELSYSYVPSSSTKKLLSAVSLAGSSTKDQVAAQALAYANKTGKTVTVNTVWWSDATAIAQKVTLAKTLGLGGVALFKIDGAEDADAWDSL
jgi:spore germination protein YaaH